MITPASIKLAKMLGLPKGTTSATLVMNTYDVPVLAVTQLVIDAPADEACTLFVLVEKANESNPAVDNMLSAYLKAHGFDGLAGEGCGCLIDDLAPCNAEFSRCKAGYKHTDPQHPERWVTSTSKEPPSEEQWAQTDRDHY